MEITIRQPQCFSEIGRKDNQEDCLFPSPSKVSCQQDFFILCDGMGGHAHGEVASQTVCLALGHYLEEHGPAYKKAFTSEDFRKALEYAYGELDKHDDGSARSNRMGTTLTCLIFHAGGYLAAHIGDSRIYHIRPSLYNKKTGQGGILYQSADHSLVNQLLQAGELTPEEAVNYPHKNIITRVMQPGANGHDKADIYQFSDICAGDYFFLCCDGVLEQLTNQHLCKILATPGMTDKEKMQAVKAVCDGKTRDNYTAWLIPVEKVDGTPISTPEDSTLKTIKSDVLYPENAANKGAGSIKAHIESSKNQIHRKVKGWWIVTIIFFIVLIAGVTYYYRSVDMEESAVKNPKTHRQVIPSPSSSQQQFKISSPSLPYKGQKDSLKDSIKNTNGVSHEK